MHIKEVNEELDYDLFMNEGLPDDAGHGEYTEALGRRTWGLLHGLADNYGCDACKGSFQTLISGIHDMVNLHLGKKVHDPKRFKEFVEMVYIAEERAPARAVHREELEDAVLVHG